MVKNYRLRKGILKTNMTTYFISRHAGAIHWAKQQGFDVDKQLHHFEPEITQKNDIIIGTLPINLVAEVCLRGGRYFHLSLDLPVEIRGKELSANDMEKYNARLEEYKATQL